MLNKHGSQKEVEVNDVDDGAHSEPFRQELISILDQGIEALGPDFENKEEVEDARQAVTLLKQN